jgi:hypothetical protein
MTPRRWLEEEPGSVESRLLRAGQRLEPPASAYQKTMVGLGLTTSTLVGAQAASASAASAKLAVAGATKLGLGATLGGVVVKGIAVGVLIGAAVLGAVQASRSLSATDRVSSPKPQAVASKAVSTRTRPSETVTEAAATARAGELTAMPIGSQSDVNSQPRANEPTSQTPTNIVTIGTSNPDRGAQVARQTTTGTSLGAEVALIDRTRQALDQGEPARALTLLSQHRRDFASPRLREESYFLRARALENLGQRDEAARALEQFRREYPDSTLEGTR